MGIDRGGSAQAAMGMDHGNVSDRSLATYAGDALVSPELDRALCERHPKIFAERHVPEIQSAMGRGFAIGDGWYRLVDALCAALQWETDQNQVPQVVATQVKEKLGGLRFYVRAASERQRATIDFAVVLSMRVCETCGAPGRLGHFSGAGISTRCGKHGAE
jgi:hypothetical protein